MNSSKQEIKVGLFVLILLGALATLMIAFSKGVTAFKQTYEIKMRSTNVSGLLDEAEVQMAGVRIGNVGNKELAAGGKSVIVTLVIEEEYQIHADAVFAIEQAGFLGDQYVAITPGENKKPPLREGDEVECEAPFNFQQAGRIAQNLLKRVDDTVATLQGSLERLDRTLMAEANLINLTNTISNFAATSENTATTFANFETMSSNAVLTVDELRSIVAANRPGINQSISNVMAFSGELRSVTNLTSITANLDKLLLSVREMVSTNQASIGTTAKNLEEATSSIKTLVADLNEGKGLVGGLLKDDLVKVQLSQTVSNMSVLSSNLNRFGLLYKPKKSQLRASRTNSIYQGRSPFTQ